MNRIVATVSVAALAVGTGLTAGIVAAAPATAAVTNCSAADNTIYTPPASPGAPGTLIACRSVTASLLNQKNDINAFKVLYASKDAKDKAIAVSGLVLVPKAAWKGTGTRPIVAFNPGTLGIGTQCAFSKQLTGQFQDAYEGGNIDRMLKAGYAVAATDGVGYLNGQTHPYVIGANAAHAVLDIAKTATTVPGANLTAGTKIGISGYSEGGQASLWASQLAKSYAPQLNIVGAAAGGVPGDLTLVGEQLNGGPFAGFLADAAIGLSTAYPELPFDELLNAKGKESVAKAKTLCLLGTLAAFTFNKIEDFTTKGYSLQQLRAIKGADGTTWGQVLDAQTLGLDIGKPGSGKKYEIGFPTFQYRGAAEEIINTKSIKLTRERYCDAGLIVDWKTSYPGEHLTTDWEASADVTEWLGDRFAGKTTKGNCWVPSL